VATVIAQHGSTELAEVWQSQWHSNSKLAKPVALKLQAVTNHSIRSQFSMRAFLAAAAFPVLLLVAPGACCHAADGAGGSERPNIVFIMADDLGYADVGCYGQRRIKTPNIDRLAVGGMIFRQYYAGSAVCAPSRCVLMTGKHSGHSYVRDNVDPGTGPKAREERGQVPIPADTTTLADLLHARGYATGGFGKWGLGGLGTTGDPLRHGFDQFAGYLDQWHAHNFYPTFIFDSGARWPLKNPAIDVHEKFPATTDWNDAALYRRFIGSDYVPDLLAERALAFVRKHAEQPFFLYYPTTVPHVALQVPEDSLAEYRGQWPDPPYHDGQGYAPQAAPRAAYAAMITRMDRDVGRIVDLVTELGLAERTIFVFTSDNGPANYSGGADTEFFQSAGKLRGKKGSLFEGGVRVPCIVRWSGKIAAGTTSDRVVGAEDWLPTLLRLSGDNGELPAGLDGVSFAPTLLGHAQPARDFLYREYPNDGGWQSVRVADWKAIRQNLLPRGKNAEPDLRTQLYNLADDPSESTDVAAGHADVVQRLADLLREQHTPSKEFPLPALDRESAKAEGGR
jgi:arylsulfatase A-like enzyme